jgi:hypothetical protein
MKRSLLACCAGLALLVACNNVDKDGTADKLVTSIEQAQDVKLNSEQRGCVKDLVKSYSDSDLRALSKNTAATTLSADFGAKLEACVRGASGVATTTSAVTASSVVDTATTVAPAPSTEAPTTSAG